MIRKRTHRGPPSNLKPLIFPPALCAIRIQHGIIVDSFPRMTAQALHRFIHPVLLRFSDRRVCLRAVRFPVQYLTNFGQRHRFYCHLRVHVLLRRHLNNCRNFKIWLGLTSPQPNTIQSFLASRLYCTSRSFDLPMVRRVCHSLQSSDTLNSTCPFCTVESRHCRTH